MLNSFTGASIHLPALDVNQLKDADARQHLPRELSIKKSPFMSFETIRKINSFHFQEMKKSDQLLKNVDLTEFEPEDVQRLTQTNVLKGFNYQKAVINLELQHNKQIQGAIFSKLDEMQMKKANELLARKYQDLKKAQSVYKVYQKNKIDAVPIIDGKSFTQDINVQIKLQEQINGKIDQSQEADKKSQLQSFGQV